MKRENKKPTKINESQLRDIVRESIKAALLEEMDYGLNADEYFDLDEYPQEEEGFENVDYDPEMDAMNSSTEFGDQSSLGVNDNELSGFGDEYDLVVEAVRDSIKKVLGN